MPIPIRPNYGQPEQSEQNTNIDFSFLLNDYDQRSKKTVTASNRDAKLLMDIWLKASKTQDDAYVIDDLETQSRDVMRLKTLGFITGGTQEVKFTERGKMIIKTMALGETNKFEKDKKDKSYTEILAGMKPDKKGLRDPRFASNHNLTIDLTKLDGKRLK